MGLFGQLSPDEVLIELLQEAKKQTILLQEILDLFKGK
jgi:hypothetical protein